VHSELREILEMMEEDDETESVSTTQTGHGGKK
jgi:hypothetical protein